MASWSKKSSSWKTSKPGRKGMARKKRKNTRGKTKPVPRQRYTSKLVCPTMWYGLKVHKAKGGRCYVLRAEGTKPRVRFVKKIEPERAWSQETRERSAGGGGYNLSYRSSGSYLRGLRNKRKGLRGTKRSYRRR